MVNFSKSLQQSKLAEWEGHYLDYKGLKKKLKQYAQGVGNGTMDKRAVTKDFSKTLDVEIEKVVLFLIEQQGILAGRVAKLGEEEETDMHLHSCEIYDRHEAYRVAGMHLLHLFSFIELNATGLRKILKKFDKKFDYGFTEHFVCSRANHRFSQLQQLFTHGGIATVMEAIINGLTNLQECPTSSCLPPPPQDPVITTITTEMNKLNESSKFLHSLAQHKLILDEEVTSPIKRRADNQKYHLMSLLLNLANAFLYMVNTYVIFPTAGGYSMSLGHASTACGVIIGAMAFAQLFSTLYLSAWSDKSYYRPLVFSSIILIVGNTLYALADDMNSIWIALIGRFICGLGYARPVNRRYISDCVPLMNRMYASAGLVCASALGVSCGPALAGLLQIDFRIYKFTFNEQTLPGWVMAAAWFLYLVWLCISFEEPSHKENVEHDLISGQIMRTAPGKDISQPLLLSSEDNKDDDIGDKGDKRGEASHQESRRVTVSAASACGSLVPSVKVQLLTYFMLKYVVEILLSESSIITSHNFDWSTTEVSIFLACLTLTAIPVNVLVGSYISNKFEERQIFLASEILVCVGIVLGFHYKFSYSVSVPQYVCFALVTFISAQILQGANLLLLSRLFSSRFSQGAFNGEVLATEVGATARVVADVSITLLGHLGYGELLNYSLLPPLLICLSSIVTTCWTYNSLY